MLKSIKHIIGFHLRATDGELGRVKDFYFDDHEWAVRYVVVDTGGWLSGRTVLIAPVEFGPPDWDNHVLPVSLTRKQVEESPGIESHVPVSRQHELALGQYYGWVPYWGPIGMATEATLLSEETQKAGEPGEESAQSPYLRSAREVIGYTLQAADGRIGHVVDFLTETEDWGVRYLTIRTRNWIPGRKVIISPSRVDKVIWEDHRVYVNLTTDEIRHSPEFDESIADTPQESVLHEHSERK
jgi:hypothetical protein